jgi:putative nucleotidyltransferase with HDIG domain
MSIFLENHPIDERLVEIFGKNVFAIGGRVRDCMINRFHRTNLVCKDFDFVVVGRTLDHVTQGLQDAGARVDAVGASFAVLKVTFGSLTVDVALPRRESSSGAGHRDFHVDFGPEVKLQDDQRRRDFTINALSIRLADQKMIETPGAIDDLIAKRIRVLHSRSFNDDPLRMLRAIGFASRFGFEIEPETARLIRGHLPLLATVSAERINEELCKIIMRSPRPSAGIRLLREFGMLPFVLPELVASIGVEQNKHHAHDVFEHLCAALDASAAAGGDLIDRLAALLHDIGKPATAAPRPDGAGNTFHGHQDVGADMAMPLLRRLRFSEETAETVTSLIRQHMFDSANSDGTPFSDAAVRRLIRRIGPTRVERQFALRTADMLASGKPREERKARVDALHERMRSMFEQQPALDVKALAIDGSDVIAHLIASGNATASFKGDRRVGDILRAVLELVIDDPALNTRERLLQMLPTFM